MDVPLSNPTSAGMPASSSGNTTRLPDPLDEDELDELLLDDDDELLDFEEADDEGRLPLEWEKDMELQDMELPDASDVDDGAWLDWLLCLLCDQLTGVPLLDAPPEPEPLLGPLPLLLGLSPLLLGPLPLLLGLSPLLLGPLPLLLGGGPPLLLGLPPLLLGGPPLLLGVGPPLLLGVGPPLLLGVGPPLLLGVGPPLLLGVGPPLLLGVGPPLLLGVGPPLPELPEDQLSSKRSESGNHHSSPCGLSIGIKNFL